MSGAAVVSRQAALRHVVRAWALGLGLISGLSQAAPGQAPLELAGSGPYHTVTLPMAVQAAAARPDLSDVQVLNARGESVPMAWGDALPPGAVQSRQAVPLFKLPASAASGVTADARGGWIFDARAVPGAQLQLHLTLAPQAQGVYSFTLDASPDLQHWRTLATPVQLMSLQHQGVVLDHTTLELDGLGAGYLRLRALPGSPPLPLVTAEVTSVVERRHAQPLQWSDPIAPQQCAASHCDYVVPQHLPLAQLQVLLTEPNTLAPVTLMGWAMQSPSAPEPRESRRQRLRDKLQGVSGEAPAAGAWHSLAGTTLYWLQLPEGEVRSDTLWLHGASYTHLRLKTSGPVGQLGAQPPAIRVGARARSLVFLARGAGPYRLVWGDPKAQAVALPLQELMPLRQAADALPPTARVTGPAGSVSPAMPMAGAAAPAPGLAASTPVVPGGPRYGLWAVLVLGVAAMGAMAWSLLRRRASAG